MDGLSMGHGVLYILGTVICFYLVFPMILFLCWKFSVNREKPAVPIISQKDYGIILTAYQQVDFVADAVSSLLGMDYGNFRIYVVADNCEPSEALLFEDDRVEVLFPESILASNTASHFYAIKHFTRPHEAILIMDSDNIAHPQLITELNRYFELGYRAVQGLRSAKNLDTTIACLDAARDIYYHFYDGRIIFDLGSSATLAGSGMAFDSNLYISMLKNTDIRGAGFDKVLQARLVSAGERIAFARRAIVYDQKTSGSKQLISQRSRWIATWFKYFKFGFSILYKGLASLNLNQFIFGTVLLRPPLFIFLSMAVLLMGIGAFTSPVLAAVIFCSLVIYVVSFMIPVLSKTTDIKIRRSLVFIPKFIFYQFVSLARSLFADKSNVATRHSLKKNNS
ncbi:glycosyltransferase [Pedobacter psychrodurus]|uniref:glycosyltransferase n=1 Tax=Pedobacter psychrodurus TaxID=2530456 RepID=UPI00292CADE2|nr:glycosyltransferase [Pedobacter psychrodurus]